MLPVAFCLFGGKYYYTGSGGVSHRQDEFFKEGMRKMSHLLKTVRKAALVAVGAVSVACMTSQAGATITGGNVTSGGPGAMFVKLTVPLTGSSPFNTVGNDNFQDPNLYGFDESQNILLVAPLDVDILADGMGGEMGSGSLGAGTTAASHYIFFDPTSGLVEGTVEFDSNILGIISSESGTMNLSESDFLANTGVNYANPGLRGLESNDSVMITGLRQITVDFSASTPGDYIRVLTAFSPGARDHAVPEPVTATLGALGMGALAMATRRRRSA